MTERTNMPFEVKDCAIIARMGGVETAINLRELRERIAICPVECLFHHFCETLIRPSFDDPEFRNDFAIWSARQLRDRILAERLGIINPYKFDDLEQLREHVIEVIDDRLSELAYIPWVPRGNDFRFMRAVTAVFGSGIVLNEPRDLVEQLPHFSHSSVYYHFVEARRRTPEKWDDFSAWLAGFGAGTEPFLEALRSIDFYYLTLPQLKQTLLDTLTKVESEIIHDRKVARRV
jgi:hypothetical protein